MRSSCRSIGKKQGTAEDAAIADVIVGAVRSVPVKDITKELKGLPADTVRAWRSGRALPGAVRFVRLTRIPKIAAALEELKLAGSRSGPEPGALSIILIAELAEAAAGPDELQAARARKALAEYAKALRAVS